MRKRILAKTNKKETSIQRRQTGMKSVLSVTLALAMLASVFVVGFPTVAAADPVVGITGIIDLKTDDFVNPLGIDSAAPRFSWRMESNVIGQEQLSYQIIVARNDTFTDIAWDYSRTDGRSVGVAYGGDTLEACKKYYWKVKVWAKFGDTGPFESGVATFETGLLGNQATAWAGSSFISLTTSNAAQGKAPAAFRKTFTPEREVASARLYTTGLGVYEFFLNGERVGTKIGGQMVYDELKNGFTQPDKRRISFAYDITDQINSGDNVISALVASGWWSDGPAFPSSNRYNAVRAKMLLIYTDGSSQWLGTDATWQASAGASPITAAHIYLGESYNANIDTSWMSNPNFSAAGWTNAVINTQFAAANPIDALVSDPVRIRADLELKPAGAIQIYNGAIGAVNNVQHGKINVIRTYEDGEEIVLNPGEKAVVNMGQNFAGWLEIQAQGAQNTVITMRHGEWLNDNNGLLSRGNDGPEGSIYTANLKEADATDRYTMKGGGIETYHPMFTFHGFQYAEISASSPVVIHSIRGQVVTSVQKNTAELSTSNADINQLISNIFWGHYSNYLYVPTDCPQRAERQGWTGDTQVFSTTAAYNADVKGFLTKWMRDMRDTQNTNGNFSDTSPACMTIINLLYGSVGWADAGIIVPFNMYKMYGDLNIVEENYASMKRFMDAYASATNYRDGWTLYGDWLGYESTDGGMLGVCYLAWDALMMEEMALATNRTADAVTFRNKYNSQKTRFISQYLNANGSMRTPTQTGCLYALMLDFVPNEPARELIKQQLIDNIRRNGNKLQTGFLGTPWLLPVMSDNGMIDMAYQLLLQRGNPSWLYSVDQGATTTWERWNTYTKETGFGDVSMNSFNHYSYGAVAEWMYGYMAGIKSDIKNPGFKHFILKPTPSQIIKRADCSFDSAYGLIVSNWRYENDNYIYEAAVPANTSATIYLPVQGGAGFTVNGKGAAGLSLLIDGIEYVETAAGHAVFNAVAGSFVFETPVSSECYIHFTQSVAKEQGGQICMVSVNGSPAQSLPGQLKVNAFEEVTLEVTGVTPNDVDYSFASWSGDVVSKKNKITFVPEGDMNLTLNVKWNNYDSIAWGRPRTSVTYSGATENSEWDRAFLIDGLINSDNPTARGFSSDGFLGSQTATRWVMIDLGEVKTFDRFHLYPRTDKLMSDGSTGFFPENFNIQVSNAAITGTNLTSPAPVFAVTGVPAPLKKPYVVQLAEPVTGRYVRLIWNRLNKQLEALSWFGQLAEFGVYNTADMPPPLFDVIVHGGTGSGEYTAGEEVSVAAEPPESYLFRRWIAEEGLELDPDDEEELTFIMPANDVALRAVFIVDMTELRQIVADLDENYNPGAWANWDELMLGVNGALTRARNVLANENTDKVYYDIALLGLKDAIDALSLELSISGEFSIWLISKPVDGSAFDPKFGVINLSGESKQVVVYLAAYDINGKLIDLKTETKSVAAGGKEIFENILLPAIPDAKYKFFIWQDGYLPLTAKTTISQIFD